MIKYKRTKNTWADFLSSQVKVGVERNRNQVFVPEWDIWFLSLKFRFRQSRYRISGRKKACNFSFSELFSGNHFHFLYKVHRKKIFLLIFLTVPTGLPVLTVAQRQKQDILSSHKYLVSFPLNPRCPFVGWVFSREPPCTNPPERRLLLKTHPPGVQHPPRGDALVHSGQRPISPQS